MTLEEIRQSDAAFLLPSQIAPILGCDPQLIRVTAQECPERLGFPVTVLGHRTKIPRKPFLNYIDGVTP